MPRKEAGFVFFAPLRELFLNLSLTKLSKARRKEERIAFMGIFGIV
jgi:hypothetical protein